MSKKIFSATVSDNGLVHICGSGKVSDLMFSLTALARSIYEIDSLDDGDREFIKYYVQNHLRQLTFMEPDELDEELEKLDEELEKLDEELEKLDEEDASREKKLAEYKKELFKNMHDACDGNKALTKEIGNTLKELLKEMGKL